MLYNKGALLESGLEEALLLKENIVVSNEPNIGFECLGYLKFLLDNYHSLSQFTLFVHANLHPGGWRGLHGVEMINVAYRFLKHSVLGPNTAEGPFAPGYMSLNDYTLLMCDGFGLRQVDRQNMDCIFNNFYQASNRSAPKCVSMDFEASFVVGRDVVQSHSKQKFWEVWQYLHSEALKSYRDGKDPCIGMEVTWHMIFREPPVRKRGLQNSVR